MPKYESYCTHCEHIIDDDIGSDLHWFEKDFCNFECFRIYYHLSFMQCYECETLVTSQEWHFVKSLPESFIDRKDRLESQESGNITNRLLFLFDDFIFCSEDCEKRHTNKHSLCAFCCIELEKEQTISHRTIAFCSSTCERLMNIHLGMKSVKRAKCSICRELKDVRSGMIWEGKNYFTCSDDCFKMFKKRVNAKFSKPKNIRVGIRLYLRNECVFNSICVDFCRQCLQPFEIESNDGFTIAEQGQRSIFCSSTCMVFFMSHNETTTKCATCGALGRFYQMIRGSASEVRAWCSLYCLRGSQHDSCANVDNEPVEECKIHW